LGEDARAPFGFGRVRAHEEEMADPGNQDQESLLPVRHDHQHRAGGGEAEGAGDMSGRAEAGGAIEAQHGWLPGYDIFGWGGPREQTIYLLYKGEVQVPAAP
jgi:hypothetical protein